MILNYLEFFKVFPFAQTTKNTLPKFKKNHYKAKFTHKTLLCVCSV